MSQLMDSCFRRNDSTLLLKTVFAKELDKSNVTDCFLIEFARLLFTSHQTLRLAVAHRGDYQAAIDGAVNKMHILVFLDFS